MTAEYIHLSPARAARRRAEIDAHRRVTRTDEVDVARMEYLLFRDTLEAIVAGYSGSVANLARAALRGPRKSPTTKEPGDGK